MELQLNQIILDRDPAAKSFIELLVTSERDLKLDVATVYHDFPFYIDEDGVTTRANVLILSPNHGVFVVQTSPITDRTINEDVMNSITSSLDNTYSLIYSKLIRSKNLRGEQRTQLNFNLIPLVFIPNQEKEAFEFTAELNGIDWVTNIEELKKIFSSNSVRTPIAELQFKEIMAILEGSKGIIRSKERKIENKESKGYLLEQIEQDIANFDNDQKKAALMIIDGPQRIRGLAGSGKTIVLAMKAAQIHLQDPNAEILYTFYTKSLYDLIKRLITRFYRQFAEKDPNWDKIHILHAWGGRNLPGVYFDACTDNKLPPLSFSDVKQHPHPFDAVCKKINSEDLIEKYDYAILDEAQDFPQSFYRLCLKLTKNKRIIWGYDECQNILNIEIQDTKLTFGKDQGGNYLVDFSNTNSQHIQDVVLHKCYRNPRKNLLCAFALGLGIYNEQIIQMPENNDHWEDLGFKVLAGNSRENDSMVIDRPEENSPLIKNKLLGDQDTVAIHTFNHINKECEFVVSRILKDLEDELYPDDILVISLDDRNARSYLNKIATELNKKGIETYNHFEAPANSKNFSIQNAVTLTTVYKAKGNEAGSVYIVGVDAAYIDTNKDSITERNKLFTAITRSIAWVTITGLGKAAELCRQEIELTLENYPNLAFTMPNREGLKVFQRDLSMGQENMNRINRDMENLAKQLGKSKEEILKLLIEKDGDKK